MSNIELYYPDTTASKVSENNGKIYFNLSFKDDLNESKPISNNFATAYKQQFMAQKLFINSAENFPSLSDPNNPNNYATHYLVIYQKNKSSKNCVAIPICNKYNGNWSKYAKDIKNTQVRSIDKLIKNKTSVTIDLNSTMAELKGYESGGLYATYENIQIIDPDDIDNKILPTLYVIKKFIYVEPYIKTSFYTQLIQKSFKNIKPKLNNKNYKIVSVIATCGKNNASPLFDIGKPDELANLLYTNVSVTVLYIILLLIIYRYYSSFSDVKIYGILFLFCIPIIIYLSIYKKSKSIKTQEAKYAVVSMIYSIIILLSFILFKLKKIWEDSNIFLSDYVIDLFKGIFIKVIGFFTRSYNCIMGIITWPQFSSYFINDILKPGFIWLIGILIIVLLILGSIELADIEIF